MFLVFNFQFQQNKFYPNRPYKETFLLIIIHELVELYSELHSEFKMLARSSLDSYIPHASILHG